MPLTGVQIIPEYTEANMPAATSVANGTEVYNTTYRVKLRSTGTRWVPTSSFVALSAFPDTNIVQANSLEELALASLNLQPFLKYVGANGCLNIETAIDNWTVDASAKNPRIRIGTAVGVGGTVVFSAGAGSQASTSILVRIRAANSESAQVLAPTVVVGAYATGTGTINTLTADFTSATAVYANITTAVTTVGQNARLRWYRVMVEPGFI